MTVEDSHGTREACYSSNLAWFLLIGPMFSALTSRIFSIAMQNLDPSIFAKVDVDSDADANFNIDIDFNVDADTDVDPNLNVHANADRDVDPNLDVDADFE